MSTDISDYLCEDEIRVMALEYTEAFEGLTEKERMYTFYLFKAIACGWRITGVQVSKETPIIVSLLFRIFRKETADDLKNRLLKETNISEKCINAFLIYSFNVLGNMGNYRGFGDTKMIPRATREEFELIINSTLAYKEESSDIDRLWKLCGEKIFSTDKSELRLGMEGKGVNTYYSDSITKEEVKLIQQYCDENGIVSYNNRLFKKSDGSFELRMASANKSESKVVSYHGISITISNGDYAPILKSVVRYLEKAKEFSANSLEMRYIDKYIDCFNNGNLRDHIDGSALWTQDRRPVVENYIGFIENYRDPYGVRGEWEGFVAIMNKKYTKILSNLVDEAPVLLKLLPWNVEFEKPVFLKPDFTSIDIVGYFGSGIPSGINIPNYDSVRQSVGFKNVSLGNIINGKKSLAELPNFLCHDDQVLFRREAEAFSIQVGLHELLGHGSGVLFGESRNENGELVKNFDDSMINPIFGKPITSWYKEGETWSSVFSSLAGTYEECRAECVGLYLSTFSDVLHIFGYDDDACDEMIYLNWLHQIHMSFISMMAYNTEHATWTQSHCCARYVYLQVLLKNTTNLISIENVYDKNMKLVDFILHVNREKIISEGRPAIGTFLNHLQVYKSTADYEHGSAYFNQFTKMTNEFAKYREIVLEKKKPRSVFMQPNLSIENGNVVSKKYDASLSGVIQSSVDILGDEISEEDFISCIYQE